MKLCDSNPIIFSPSSAAPHLHEHVGENLQDHVRARSRIGFVLASLDEERPAGVDCQHEEGEYHAEQLHVGHPSG